MGQYRERARLDEDEKLPAGDRQDSRVPAGPEILSLQRTAGNRAVTQLLGAASRRSGEPSRYTTTDSAITNAAALLGLGGSAAAMTGAVTFQSGGFNATVAKPLAVTKTAADVEIDSQTYTATGSVTATGPAARIGDYEIGFLQTVHQSTRDFYYQPPGHTPGLLERFLPILFSDKKKITDTTGDAPVRDGDAGVVPWYGPETVDQFPATSPSTRTSTMQDTPGTGPRAWKIGSGATEQHLVRTDGRDRFRSWLAVKDVNERTAIPLNFADWEVDYSTTVTVDAGSPASSVVTPGPNSGSKVTAKGDGSGGQTPLHEDPVANDAAHDEESVW
jgi:hypothetical protein